MAVWVGSLARLLGLIVNSCGEGDRLRVFADHSSAFPRRFIGFLALRTAALVAHFKGKVGVLHSTDYIISNQRIFIIIFFV